MTADWRDRLNESLGAKLPGALNGDEASFGFQVDSVTLRGGDTFTLTPGGVTVIVGANNAGKSTVLRDLVTLLAQKPGRQKPELKAVKEVTLRKSGSGADVVAWLGNHYPLVSQGAQLGFGHNSVVHMPEIIMQSWEQGTTGVGQLSNLLTFYGNAQGRFGIAGFAEMRDTIDDPPVHPVHHLQDSKEKLAEINRVCRSIFGEGLTLDTLAKQIRLRVGSIGLEAPPIDAVTPEYRQAMAALVPLDDQGDGMRSLMGLLLPLVAAVYPLIVIDEPEAFLHPPQAHALGKELGALASKGNVQVLVATHDRSFLTGLLESGVDVSVARLTRRGVEMRAHQLSAADLSGLWTDAVLRYSNILEGLFHRLVVLAEAEGDCNFLSAALECPNGPTAAIPKNEILFVPTGGKDGMPKAARALRSVKVPVVAAPDLDILNDEGKVKALVEALGHDWTDELAAQYSIATADMTGRPEPAKVGHVLDSIVALLDPRRNESYNAEIRDQVKANLRAGSSPWVAVKDHGMSAFKGQARSACDTLMAELERCGVVPVRNGELECLAPEVTTRKGPGWLPAALAAGAQCNSNTQAHIGRVLAAGEQQSNLDHN